MEKNTFNVSTSSADYFATASCIWRVKSQSLKTFPALRRVGTQIDWKLLGNTWGFLHFHQSWIVKGGNIKGSKGKHQVHLWKVLPLALLPPKTSSFQTTGPVHRIKMTAACMALWNPFHHCFFLCCCLSWTLTLHKQLFWSNASIHANRPL